MSDFRANKRIDIDAVGGKGAATTHLSIDATAVLAARFAGVVETQVCNEATA